MFDHVYYWCCFFFFNDTATTEIYTLSLHDALPTSSRRVSMTAMPRWPRSTRRACGQSSRRWERRSEEHTSELQSHSDLVCRLLLEKKKTKKKTHTHNTQTTQKTQL